LIIRLSINLHLVVNQEDLRLAAVLVAVVPVVAVVLVAVVDVAEHSTNSKQVEYYVF
jgi:hypothetical protein